MTDEASAAAGVDDALMVQIKAGSLDAFCDLYDRHWSRARDLAERVGDRDVADAIVRDAFASVWDRRDEYRVEGGVVAEWIGAAVQVRVMQADIAATGASPLATPKRPAPAASDDDGTHMVARAEARRTEARRIGALLDGLPHVQRQVIALAFYGGLSHAEIAEHLGLSDETVRGRMRLGLEKLLVENEQRQA